VEDAPKVLEHAFISKWAVGARASGGHYGYGQGGGTYEVAGTKIYEHIHTEFSVAAMVAGSNNGLPWRRAGRQWRFAAHFDCYLIL